MSQSESGPAAPAPLDPWEGFKPYTQHQVLPPVMAQEWFREAVAGNTSAVALRWQVVRLVEELARGSAHRGAPEPSAPAVETVRETLLRMGIAAVAVQAFGQTHFDATCLMVARNLGAVGGIEPAPSVAGAVDQDGTERGLSASQRPESADAAGRAAAGEVPSPATLAAELKRAIMVCGIRPLSTDDIDAVAHEMASRLARVAPAPAPEPPRFFADDALETLRSEWDKRFPFTSAISSDPYAAAGFVERMFGAWQNERAAKVQLRKELAATVGELDDLRRGARVSERPAPEGK